MNFDELAAASILLEPHNKPELQRMLLTITVFSQKETVPVKARELALEIKGVLEKLASGLLEDFETKMLAVGRGLASIKEMMENPGNTPVLTGPVAPMASEKIVKPATAAAPPLIDLEVLTEFLNEAQDHFQVVEANLLSLENNPEDMELINGVFRAFHSTKSMAGFIGLTEAAELAHKAERFICHARNRELKLVGNYADLALEASDALKAMISMMKDYQDGPLPLPPENLGEVLQKLDALENELTGGAPVTPEKKVCAPVEIIRPPVELCPLPVAETSEKTVAEAADFSKNKNDAKQADATVRISTRRLDKLIDMVGELVITNSMVVQNEYVQSETDAQLTGNVMQLDKIARELQDLGVSMRMIPLKSTFQKVERLVRDLSRKIGKPVNFKVEGEDTEIDRGLVESLSDPLVHMVRNAVDHGLETPAERIAKGKSPEGQLLLRAYHRAGNVILELKDDGRGLDREKIIAKALKNGLISDGAGLEEKEVFDFIFKPGFSTAEKVTEVSGRGVGMDVVRRSIESMNGKVEVSSWKDQGTLFSLRIPLTLAIIDGLLIKVAQHEYLVSTLAVKAALRPEENQVVTLKGQGEMLRFRDTFLPVFRLHQLFQLPAARQEPTEAMLLVVEHENEMCALMADDLLGQQQVVIKSMGMDMKKMEYISGAAILGDGRIRLIIDVAGIMNLACTQPYKEQGFQVIRPCTPADLVAC
ncbi:MAG: chemotaxis protein CheA [Candidatus Firestonebacteria bacterium]|nr:chemotaxis protein CheA [Candidatus Firestonebacteria bacterium]